MNPVDYKIWAVMKERVYEKRVNDVDELCQRLLSVWHSIGQNVIDEAINQWRARLTACVRAKGGHYPRDATLARVIEIATCPSVRHAPVLCQNEES